MNLQEALKHIGANECDTDIKVTFADGRIMTGLFTDYTYEDDNAEEVASIDLKIGEVEYCLFENEIASIELA